MEHATYTRMLGDLAGQCPDAPALCYKGETAQKLTFRELDLFSSLAAEKLISAGCTKGMAIPVVLNRGLDCVVWALGVIKTGATAVQLAADIPLNRARYIFEDTGAPFILTHQDLAHRFPGCPCETVAADLWQSETWQTGARQSESLRQAQAARENLLSGDTPMLVYYTSGTTGNPKGVVFTHANVLGFARRHNAFNNITTDTRVAAFATVSFDAFVMDLYAPLAAGARVFLLGEEERISLVALHRYYMRHKIHLSFLTTRVGEAYMQAFDNPHLRRLLTGGEVLREFVPRSYEVFNIYGPTETTAYVTAFPITRPLSDYPLGQALPGMKVMLLDENLAPCPPGRTGEICISGDQVSAGYLNQPLKTAQGFTANPLYDPEKEDPAFSRIYRTGDLGLLGQDGQIYFRGRKDHQIKIRGCRIETIEVETALLAHPEVRQAHVRPFTRGNGETGLAAYVVRCAGQTGTDAFFHSIKEYLKDTLPVQMIPGRMAELPSLPLNANGKVDGAALADPGTLGRL
ncbi:amino acid adenylation domain-containing protein [Desulfobacter sp.]|uniref:amino acid adenylation domain-containing protein n=1 Tax=Desulfobacter sp. TaxID=2294 RepID=UPI003D0FA7FC